MGCWSWSIPCRAPPWQRWWPRAHCRRCPALARRYGAIACSSITATRCGSATYVCAPCPMSRLAVCHGAGVTRDGTPRQRGEDPSGLVREAGHRMTHTTDERCEREHHEDCALGGDRPVDGAPPLPPPVCRHVRRLRRRVALSPGLGQRAWG